jgi:hypothetical protein
MPCALTEPDNYPGYLKSILKEIAAGNDDNLKTCACSLTSPVTDEGCVIVDEDGKVGAFPFCCSLVTDGVGNNTSYPLKLTLKQAMLLYWQTIDFTHNITPAANYAVYGQPPGECGAAGGSRVDQTDSDSILIADADFNIVTEAKQRACPCHIYLLYTFPDTSPQILGYFFFGSELKMKYKKEGEIYYFYPKFEMSRIGDYNFAWSINEFSSGDCPCDCCSPYLTYTDFQVKINGIEASEAPIKVSLCNSNGSCAVCNNFKSNIWATFSTLEFNTNISPTLS